jgi:hypothetical protein
VNQPRSGRPITSRNPENVERVRASIRENPELSTRRRSDTLGVPRTSLICIVYKVFHLHPYKIQMVQELKSPSLKITVTGSNLQTKR